MRTLYETLQAEFCPQLDSSLLAAIIADHAGEDDTTLTPGQILTIRETLSLLANQAQIHEHELEAIEAVEASIDSYSNMSTTSPTTPELGDSTTTTSSASDTSSSQHSFNSPLGFLQEAFMHLPTERLKRLLRKATGEMLGNEGDVDMEKVVEYILTMEHIRELEERGLDAPELSSSPSPSEDWETVVRTKPKSTPKLAIPPKKKAKGRTIKIVDVRQMQHALPPPAKAKVTMDSDVDVWTHVSSLSTQLAALLPPTPASHFTSFFHSPTYATPAYALRAALEALPSTSSSTKHLTKPNSPIKQPNQFAESNTLSALLDLLQASPTFTTLDAEQRDTLYTDARLALTASRNRPDEALDIVWILRDLDHPGSNTGIYHLPPPSSNVTPTTRVKSPTGPSALQLPPTSKRKFTSSLSSPTSPTKSPTVTENPWQAIPSRSSRTTHQHEDHNPAHKRKVRGAGNGLGKRGKVDDGELPSQGVGGNHVGHAHFMRRTLQARKERDDLLREASRAWRKPWGGDIALHYAQQARAVTEKARRDALDEARRLVEARRSATRDKRTIDLHGTCVQEAIVITSEILEREECSPASPLHIITGRGSHSVGGVGVLKPAVHRALVDDGWDVRMWDGGLDVRGRERGGS